MREGNVLFMPCAMACVHAVRGVLQINQRDIFLCERRRSTFSVKKSNDFFERKNGLINFC